VLFYDCFCHATTVGEHHFCVVLMLQVFEQDLEIGMSQVSKGIDVTAVIPVGASKAQELFKEALINLQYEIFPNRSLIDFAPEYQMRW
jgi:hypothetical protein